MFTLARAFRVDLPQTRVWERLNDLGAIAGALPAVTDVTADDRDELRARFGTRVGLLRLAGVLSVRVVQRSECSLLVLRGEGQLDVPGSFTRFEVAWHLEPTATDQCRVVYLLKLRAGKAVEGLAQMTLSRKAESLDRHVLAALTPQPAREAAA